MLQFRVAVLFRHITLFIQPESFLWLMYELGKLIGIQQRRIGAAKENEQKRVTKLEAI
jgi:hypothetical protein